METNYNKKFEEMKKYIPFLESMITRLETSSPTNPRQAQLDKIKSLRDLLQDKKKRMKMENLLKCEQVLVNLYAKVEQKDGGLQKKNDENDTQSNSTDLNAVRNKLKSVALKLNQATIPAIGKLSETEEFDVQGNKESALFQRRPSLISISPVKTPVEELKTSPQSKRNYTRVLLSPETSPRKWSEKDSKIEKPLYSRRSPRKNSNRYSPSYKKERKKTKKSKNSMPKESTPSSMSEDLNITLKVPEESLSSLDTDDILSRIINCSDGDVDIDTLRELRSQILGELKTTGVKDDISDLLLKSCKKNTTSKEKTDEIEEGELSDSESETIENIYGSLVVTDKDKSTTTIKTSLGKDNARKIQICLVINSDKNQSQKDSNDNENKSATAIDVSEFQSFSVEKKPEEGESLPDSNEVKEVVKLEAKEDSNIKKEEIDLGSEIDNKEQLEVANNISVPETSADTPETNKNMKTFVPNFYKPSNDEVSDCNPVLNSSNCNSESSTSEQHIIEACKEIPTESSTPNQSSMEIPLLDIEATAKQEIVSEIDILQALKKEILGETSPAPITEAMTPPLHQPKVTKVSKAQEIVKKRISIENYKQKCNVTPSPLFLNDIKKKNFTEDKKKQSLKLTEKECERFNFPIKLPLNESSEDDDNSFAFQGIYSNLAPKSPDHEDFADTGIKPPVIIPSDPVKPTIVSSPIDVDMRNANNILSKIPKDTAPISKDFKVMKEADKPKSKLSDPRRLKSRWEPKQSIDTVSNQVPHSTSQNKTTHSLPSPNMTSSRIIPVNNISSSISVTSNPIFIPNMTPNAKTYEMTPSRLNESEDISNQKPVYSPMFSDGKSFELNEIPQDTLQRDREKCVWKQNSMPMNKDFGRYNDVRQDRFDTRDVYGRSERSQTPHSFGRIECPSTPLPSFGRMDCPTTPLPSFGRMDCPTTPLPSFGRMDCPTTPLPSFGRMDCPTTPLPSFGRMDCPTTPLPSFGRMDCPTTPLPSFGRMDCPTTPLPSFGRMDCPTTPIASFGRAERPMTPINSCGILDGSGTPAHSFGRSDDSMSSVYSFGRSDGSATPIHSFNFSDCSATTSRSYSRSDSFGGSDRVQNYSTTKPMYGRQDPRLNRSSDYGNLNKGEDDREFGYNRNKKYNSGYNKNSKYFDTYNRHDQSYGRTEINRSRDRNSDRYYRDYESGRDQSVGRSVSKDKELNSRRCYRDSKNYNQRNYGRDKSVERNYTSSPKRFNEDETRMSVTRDIDKSFTIDTSVNTTFQAFEGNQQLCDNFISRRQRASSVGRILTRECSLSRTTNTNTRSEFRKIDNVDKRKDFHRASSVGRDVNIQRSRSFKDIKEDLRSFKLKNDFNIRSKEEKINTTKIIDVQKSNENCKYMNKTLKPNQCTNDRYSPRKNYRDPRVRRESRIDNNKPVDKSRFHEARRSGIVYSNANISSGTILGPGYAVKNYKIPKIKRSPERIVPSEITEKSSIDVKEKIKKPENNNQGTKLETSKVKENNDVEIEINNKKRMMSKKTKEHEKNTEKGISIEISERRITRSAKITSSSSDFDVNISSPSMKTRKSKRIATVCDNSESDVEEVIIKTEVNNDKKNAIISSEIDSDNTNIEPITKDQTDNVALASIEECVQSNITKSNEILGKNVSAPNNDITNKIQLNKVSEEIISIDESNEVKNNTPILPNNEYTVAEKSKEIDTDFGYTCGTKNNDELNSSFGDLEIFSDNIASDPVLDNINALIEDLNHDLDTAKNNNSAAPFTQEILLENMLENIRMENIDTEAKSLEINETEEHKDGSIINKLVVQPVEDTIIADNISEGLSSDYSHAILESDFKHCSLQQNLNEITETVTAPQSENKAHDDKSIDLDNDSNEAIVSTTKEDVQKTENIQNIENPINHDISNIVNKAIPDSTINVTNQSHRAEETVPDSTNECNDITSSSSEKTNKYSSNIQSPQIKDQSDSIGNFLSILQDKSKIKELLSLLGEKASDNAKMKKKLEKLSAIVSDDDDDEHKDESHKEVTVANKPTMLGIEKTDEIKLSEEASKKNILEREDNNKIETIENNSSQNITLDVEKQIETLPPSNEKNNTSEEKGDPDLGPNVPVAESKCETQKEIKVTKKGRRKKLNKAPPTKKSNVKKTDTNPKTKVKKPSRELLSLQADIREIFLKDDEEILGGTTGLRMCRLAKLVDEKSQNAQEEMKSDTTPSARSKKLRNTEGLMEGAKNVLKKKTSKISKAVERNIPLERQDEVSSPAIPRNSMKSAPKANEDHDPFVFDTDSVTESISASEKRDTSECESDSVDSSRSELTEFTSEIKKKPKRKRSSWQSGVIVPKNRRKKNPTPKPTTPVSDTPNKSSSGNVKTLDANCYIDTTYCFSKNVLTYSCRFCDYSGSDIVGHYKKQHPHSEIPLSRISPDVAREAIKQCETIDFQAISNVPNHRYTCLFCFKEFLNCKSLDSFFWHVVGIHTGEYKEACTVCDPSQHCPQTLDIPPPPMKRKGQLTGYICGKCNFTQISLENLKSHVITRHNDEQTEVYTINLCHMTTKAMNMLIKRAKKYNTTKEAEKQRVLRSSRTNASTEVTEDKSDCAGDSDIYDSSSSSFIQESNVEGQQECTLKSKITFEADNDTEKHEAPTSFKIKQEPNETTDVKQPKVEPDRKSAEGTEKDIIELPHFKVAYSESGSKEYVCCINDQKNHYRTSLLISFKKHVQFKHTEKWDGFCCVCKVIVTSQGKHSFKDCLQHFIDNHMDNFPVFEPEPIHSESKEMATVDSKPYLTVRPLSDLISKAPDEYPSSNSPLPVIESVVSLGAIEVKTTSSTSIHSKSSYEEAQAKIMSKKNQIILESMMSNEKLVQVFKCAGRFCSYTTDSAEDALLHASTHSRIGGDGALNCVYCDYDSSNNAIDLVTHVFKAHGFCQYACGFCFYRAAASQLVNAHLSRVHENSEKIVLKTSFATEPLSEEEILTREVAVPYYVCNCGDAGTKCKFRTYTPGKLCQHVQSKHSKEAVFECFTCGTTLDNVTELIRHYKSHGLKLYQCVWCVFGADNENELLLHSSSQHPTYQPKAYLRVITNKEGLQEYRVLPLVYLNKSDIITTDISPTVKENPVREAERSMDLEKLIGHTTYIEPVDTEPSNENHDESIKDSMLNFVPDIRPCTPPVPVTADEQSTPIIKQDTNEPVTPKSDDVVCIDSDEDDTNISNASNTSVDVISSTEASLPSDANARYPLKLLYKCSKCSVISKNSSAFRIHIAECYPNNASIPCAYCSFKGRKTQIAVHYTKTHNQNNRTTVRFDCHDCGATFMYFERMRKHQKLVHNATDVDIKIYQNTEGVTVREVTGASRPPRKRKSQTATEEPPAKRKFGPMEIDLLPINPIFEDFAYCSLCEFSTKVRSNMFRHLLFHANQQPVAQTAPVNPVPHLETNEKHFDKMVNLASSSIASRAERTTKVDPTVTVLMPPEKASRYPKYVLERIRHTCGAKGCSYISLDENMLKYHWETLHSDSSDFHCVHCPPYQTLDTKTPLTATRIISHLRMHDVRLYACSRCMFYHYKRQVVEKHVEEVHKGGSVMIVREEISVPSTSQATPVAAPTMDLKPWQCGVCDFKSLLRPEVIEHCAKVHNSKMQFKCVYCAFRTSNMENVTKHQSNSHQDSPPATFFYYYREGSMADEADGTPFWEMQRRKFNFPDTRVKTENVETPCTSSTPESEPVVNLSIVKQEIRESAEESIDELCKHFGEFCPPNGLRYKCPLCKYVIEDTKEGMQSHLFEELQYRKWSCSICFYKAFHKRGLSEHMEAEHRQSRDPVELPVDVRVEVWVTKLLEHQEAIIDMNKSKLAQQKVEILKKPPDHVVPMRRLLIVQTETPETTENYSKENLEDKFGPLGESKNMSFCCPKCEEVFKDESAMRDHLESELNKIRWCCSSCPEKFQSYHQAQHHCKIHSGQSSRPLEASRDSALRTAWVEAVLSEQKLSMNYVPTPADIEETRTGESPEPENSLLVVRYEENVPMPEVQSAVNVAPDSDDERLVINEAVKTRKRKRSLPCSHCSFTSTSKKLLHRHVIKHYGLKPYACGYCNYTGTKKVVERHQAMCHTTLPGNVMVTDIPEVPPSLGIQKTIKASTAKLLICLTCQERLMDIESLGHVHGDSAPDFAKIGEVVVRCCTCNNLHKNIDKFMAHNSAEHPDENNFVFYKLLLENRLPQALCFYCPQKFSLKKDLKVHIEAMHAEELKYATIEPRSSRDVIVLDDEDEGMAEVTLSRRKVARKSTTKLPKTRTVARKSTTRLPLVNVPEYSFYGTRPSTEGLENVTTLMPFYNTLMPVTLEKLRGVLNLTPKVVVARRPDNQR